jgi:short subunit dehydrogenase-like uncharacterized protein
MSSPHAVVYGATGHTGRMVAQGFRARGWSLTLAGRRHQLLDAMADDLGAVARVASIESPEQLDAALAGADIVVNCAGPFRDTTPALIAAALRAGIPYLDVAAELEAIIDVIRDWDAPARKAGVTVVPGMGFYGGLGDLVATEALGDWTEADRIEIGYGLNEWIPTGGTLASGVVSDERRAGKRAVFANGTLTYTDEPRTTVDWDFPAPIGHQSAVPEMTMADTITIPHHVRVREMVSYMPTDAVAGLSGESVRPAGETAHSSRQRFALQVTATLAGAERRCTVRGGDIYAVTAPLVVAAATIILTSPDEGVRVAGELGAPGELLRSLEKSGDIEVERH